jgi:hypothetical protein
VCLVFYLALFHTNLSKQQVRVTLDKGWPFIDLKEVSLRTRMLEHPLLYLADNAFRHKYHNFYSTKKIHLLLERGVDVSVHDQDGRSCIHLALNSLEITDVHVDHYEVYIRIRLCA